MQPKFEPVTVADLIQNKDELSAPSIRSYRKDSPLATHRMIAAAYAILAENLDGVRWTDLLKAIQQADPALHPKTINGCGGSSLKNFR